MRTIHSRAWLWGAAGAAIAVPAIAFAWKRASRRSRPRSGPAEIRVRRRAWLLIPRKVPSKASALPAGPRPMVRRWAFDAPRERVFAYWTAFASFPDFMDSVMDARETKPGCYRIRLRGPGGRPAAWDAVIERLIPGEAVEWTSDPQSEVQCAGRAEFLPVEGGGTLVELRLEYGASSSWLAKDMEGFLRQELPGLISRDVLRMKELIETGSAGL